MKRQILITVLAIMSVAVYGQTVGEVTDSVKQVFKHGSMKEKVSTIKGAFASKAAAAEELIGTWVYVEPAVLNTSGGVTILPFWTTLDGVQITTAGAKITCSETGAEKLTSKNIVITRN